METNCPRRPIKSQRSGLARRRKKTGWGLADETGVWNTPKQKNQCESEPMTTLLLSAEENRNPDKTVRSLRRNYFNLNKSTFSGITKYDLTLYPFELIMLQKVTVNKDGGFKLYYSIFKL